MIPWEMDSMIPFGYTQKQSASHRRYVILLSDIVGPLSYDIRVLGIGNITRSDTHVTSILRSLTFEKSHVKHIDKQDSILIIFIL